MIFLALANHRFFWAKPHFPGAKQMPLWLGRALFIFVGLGFAALGMRYFLAGY